MKKIRARVTEMLCALMMAGYAVALAIAGTLLICLIGATLADAGGNSHLIHNLWAWWGDTASFKEAARLAMAGTATMVLYPLAIVTAPDDRHRQLVQIFNPTDLF